MTLQNPDSWPLKLTLLLTSTLTIMAGATIAPSLPAMQTHFAHVSDQPGQYLWFSGCFDGCIGCPFLDVPTED